MEERIVKVIIVDDNEIFRKGLKFYLENIKNFQVLNENSDGDEFLESDNMYIADIVLMDIEMPKMNGLEAAKNALWRYSELKIIAITNYKDKAYLSELIGVGFKGCVFKDEIYNELETAINTVLSGDIYYPEDINL